MKKYISYITIALLIGCTKEEISPRQFPRVRTGNVSNISSVGATFSGEITFASVEIIDHGFVWSQNDATSFTLADRISLGPKSSAGPFETTCDYALQQGVKYTVRAYAISNDKTVFGDPIEFVSMGSKAPVLKDFFPATATWEDTITLVGENFSIVRANLTVKFNDRSALILKSTTDTIYARVPFDLGTDESILSVSISGNNSILNSKPFKLKPPVIESILPPEGAPGNHITLTGKFFNSVHTKVYFNGVEGLRVSGTVNSVTAKVPSGLSPGPVDVKFVTGSGSLFDMTAFTVRAPLLSQLSPSSAGEGDEIKLIGNFFSPDKSDNIVTFGNTPAVVTSATATELKVIVPSNVATINADVKVTSGNIESNTMVFGFASPVVESFTPTSGYGIVITVTGKNFRVGAYNKVYIGDALLEYSYAHSPTKIEGTLYELTASHSGKVKVTLETQEGISAQDFKMNWARLTDHPAPNAPTRAFVNGNDLYATFGWWDFNKLWRFNTATKTWTQMADFPGQIRDGYATFTAGTKGYIGGGVGSYAIQNDWWEYNTSNNTWTQKANLPMSGILIRGSFAYNGSGYILTYNEQASSSTSTLWKYNHTNDSWSTVSTAPFPLPSMTHPFILETSAYVLADNKLWKFDFATNAWTLTDAQHYDAPSITTTIGGVVYGVNYNGFQRFDPVNNMWNYESSPLPYQQNPSILFTANGRGYAIAGEKVLEYLP